MSDDKLDEVFIISVLELTERRPRPLVTVARCSAGQKKFTVFVPAVSNQHTHVGYQSVRRVLLEAPSETPEDVSEGILGNVGNP